MRGEYSDKRQSNRCLF